MKKVWYIAVIVVFFSLFSFAAPTYAVETETIGIHILQPEELGDAKQVVRQSTESEKWHYVTVPFTLQDMEQKKKWQTFFDNAKKEKIIPIVRLTTTYENESWIVPNKKQIVDQLTVLGSLKWPTKEKYIIVFNEVNHAKEWGGRIDPAEYARVLKFTSNWARSENKNFVILPAAMDLAAPNGSQTKEAFTYLREMHEASPDIFDSIDIWNSHSYPNPGFSSAPTRTEKNSLSGFKHELAFLKEKTGKDYKVMITETGWEDNKTTNKWLYSYYEYAVDHIWSDPQVLAVTPFILRGSPGPFSGFSFLNEEGKPTKQYLALKAALEKQEAARIAKLQQ